jgi:hypothetical protein
MNVSASEIKESLTQLGESCKISEALIEKCIILCDKYELNIEQFHRCLEAFLLSDEEFSVETFIKFEHQISRETQKERINPRHTTSSSADSPSSDFGLPGKRPFQFSSPSGDDRSSTVRFFVYYYSIVNVMTTTRRFLLLCLDDFHLFPTHSLHTPGSQAGRRFISGFCHISAVASQYSICIRP